MWDPACLGRTSLQSTPSHLATVAAYLVREQRRLIPPLAAEASLTASERHPDILRARNLGAVVTPVSRRASTPVICRDQQVRAARDSQP